MSGIRTDVSSLTHAKAGPCKKFSGAESEPNHLTAAKLPSWKRLDKNPLQPPRKTLEGPLAPLPCVSRTSYMRCRECRDERTCGIRLVMKDVRDATARILDSTTLADLLKRVEAVVAGKEGLHYAI